MDPDVRGPRGAQQIADRWLPQAVRASDLTAVGAVIPQGDTFAPALLLGWANPPTPGLVVPPVLIVDPQATLVSILETGLRMAYAGEDHLRSEGITPAEKAEQLADEVVTCAGPCGRRLFGVRADVGWCQDCQP